MEGRLWVSLSPGQGFLSQGVHMTFPVSCLAFYLKVLGLQNTFWRRSPSCPGPSNHIHTRACTQLSVSPPYPAPASNSSPNGLETPWV